MFASVSAPGRSLTQWSPREQIIASNVLRRGQNKKEKVKHSMGKEKEDMNG